MTARTVATLLLAMTAVLPAPARAQWPGALAGRVVDAATGEPVVGATVDLPELEAAGPPARTAPDGSFLLEAVHPGRHWVRASAPGYQDHRIQVHVSKAGVARVRIPLQSRPIPLEDLRVRATAPERAHVVGRADIDRSGARTAAEALDGVAGVVVQERGAGGPATASIRGSGAGQVLVMLDGAVLNDPVSGEADLSSVPAAIIESITVYRGANSARFGPGAGAGVVVIESRAPAPVARMELTAGALGERRGAVRLGGQAALWTLQAAAHAARVDGGFEFEIPPEAGGGQAHRSNADLAEVGGLLSAAGPLGGGEGRLSAGVDRLDRGLPGKSYAPSPAARQELERVRLSGTWSGAAFGGRLEAAAQLMDDGILHQDSAPPAGLPYHQTSRIRELRSEVVLSGIASGPLDQWRTGLQLSEQRIHSDALAPAAPAERLRGGVFFGGEATLDAGGSNLLLGTTARVDADGTGSLHPSYAASASVGLGPVRLHGSARSSFTPPTLADQFFRQGVAVEPNPDLRGERVPLEMELGAVVGTRGRSGPELGLTLFRGDVRDMIVWAPDFRFVWRPRNTDVRRWGGEAWMEAALPADISSRASYALAVVTYDTPGSTGAQLAYRPRHTGRLAAEWNSGPWQASVTAAYTGARYPGAARVNRLPPYWRTHLSAGREWRSSAWRAGLSVRVDRLLDERGTLIFGYPEPGRMLRLRLDLGRTLRP